LQLFSADSHDFVFIKMLRKDHYLYQTMQNLYQLVKYSYKQPELHTCYERRHPACKVCKHDTSECWRWTNRLGKPKKAGLLKKRITEFPARQWKWHAVWSLRIIESTGFAEKLSGSDRRRLEWTGSNIKSIKLQPRRTTSLTSSIILGVEMLSSLFASFYSVTTVWKMLPVLMLLSSSLTRCQTKNI